MNRKHKAIRSANQNNTIIITNYDRDPEEDVLHFALEKISQNPNLIIGQKNELPYADIYEAAFEDEEIKIIYDYDYGVMVKCPNNAVRDALIDLLNE